MFSERQIYNQYLNNLKDKTYPKSQIIQQINKKLPVINFTSHDYLNLANHPEIIKNANEYNKKYGTSGKSNMNNSLFFHIYSELEEIFLEKTNLKASLFYDNLFQANLTILPILLDKKFLGIEPIIFCDRSVDPSVIQACDSLKVKIIRYQNGNLDDLERLLSASEDKDNPKFLIIQSVNNLEGTIVNVEKIINLSQKYKCFLYVNDSDSFGIYGKKGLGIFEDYLQYIDLYILSFDKSLASKGCIILTHDLIKQIIINADANYDYNVIIPPSIIATVRKSLEMIDNIGHIRQIIEDNVIYIKKNLIENNFKIGNCNSHIISIIIGNREKTINLKKYLNDHNIIVNIAIAPSVPDKTSRLLLSINATHNREHIDKFIMTLKRYNINSTDLKIFDNFKEIC